jgi:hypothetical protein
MTTEVILVPRYVRALEELAMRRGLSVSIGVESIETWQHGDHWMIDYLVGEWRGSLRQFLSLNFATIGCRIPLHRGEIIMRASSPVRSGTLEAHGKSVLFKPQLAVAPVKLEQRGRVEVIDYDDRVAFHGTANALIGAGILEKRLTLRKLTRRQGSADEPYGTCYWDMQRQPDGTILYTEDTPQGVLARKALRADLVKRMAACRDPELEERRWPDEPPSQAPPPSYLH